MSLVHNVERQVLETYSKLLTAGQLLSQRQSSARVKHSNCNIKYNTMHYPMCKKSICTCCLNAQSTDIEQGQKTIVIHPAVA